MHGHRMTHRPSAPPGCRVGTVDRRTAAYTLGWVLLPLLAGCDATMMGTVDAGHPGDAGPPMADDAGTASSDAGSPGLDAGPQADAGASDAGPGPSAVDPCAVGTCWETSAAMFACAEARVPENFVTGTKNVHRYATTLPAGAPTEISVTRTAGEFRPALFVTRRDGEVLFDGERGLVGPGLRVTVEATGRDGDVARVLVETDADLAVHVFVTGWAVVDSGFVDFPSTSVRYTLLVDQRCEGETMLPCVLDGAEPRAPACGWLHYIAREVVPELEGDREARLTTAARVAWWSLKEHVLYLANPLSYSNCNFETGDRHIGPLDPCVPGRAWQVGLSGVQAAYLGVGSAEAIATRVHPGRSLEQILETAARRAGLDDADTAAVVATSGQMRVSWLLRDSATGFTYQVGRVTAECIDGTERWCFGAGVRFANDRAQALRVIADIRSLLDALAP